MVGRQNDHACRTEVSTLSSAMLGSEDVVVVHRRSREVTRDWFLGSALVTLSYENRDGVIFEQKSNQ